MSLQYVISDRFGTPIAELEEISARTTRIRLSLITTGSFVAQTTNPWISQLRQVDQTLLQLYRNGVLLGHGPLVPNYNKAVAADAKSLSVNWAGVGWRLGRRIIEASKSNSGVSYGSPVSPPSGYMDRGAIVASIINGLNVAPVPAGYSPTLADTGIRIGATPPSSSTAVGAWYYKNALQGVSDLTATTDPFEWKITPTLPTRDNTGLQIGTFTCAPAFGAYKPDVVWEYGDGKHNVASFTEVGDLSAGTNRVYSLPMSFPDAASDPTVQGSQVLSYADWDSVNARGTLYEDIIQNDLVVDTMRTSLMQETVAVQKLPKTVITLVPVVSSDPGVVPQYGVDYVEGDIFPFRAVEYGVETVNGLFRCYGVDITDDDLGNETVTPILVSQDS